MQKPPCLINESKVKATKENHKQIRNECEVFVLDNAQVTSIEMILRNFYVNNISGKDQISANCLKQSASVKAICLTDITNISIKFGTFHSKCKKVKRKPLFKKESKTESKNYRSILPVYYL